MNIIKTEIQISEEDLINLEAIAEGILNSQEIPIVRWEPYDCQLLSLYNLIKQIKPAILFEKGESNASKKN